MSKSAVKKATDREKEKNSRGQVKAEHRKRVKRIFSLPTLVMQEADKIVANDERFESIGDYLENLVVKDLTARGVKLEDLYPILR